MSNSIKRSLILAAGISNRFFKPLYDKPKGLFQYKNELLIERQIRQFQEAGISDIAVVIGYEKEQYFYLEQKFGVKLFVNEEYNRRGSIKSLLAVPVAYYSNSYISCADHWYQNNPFLISNFDHSRSFRFTSYCENAHGEFVVTKDKNGRLSFVSSGAENGLCLCGLAYFSEEFATKLRELYLKEQDFLGVSDLHWEEFWARHTDELPLYAVDTPSGFKEFESVGDLQRDDGDVLSNVSTNAVSYICKTLNCSPNEIENIEPINRGLTNVSFSFSYGKNKYVCRAPGYSSSSLVNRQSEIWAQRYAIELGLDQSVIDIDESGWKLAHFIDVTSSFNYDDEECLIKAITSLRKFHDNAPLCGHSIDLLKEGDRLLALASKRKGNVASNYQELRAKLKFLDDRLKYEGWPKRLCHNDVYAVNYLRSSDRLDLIDWEYAGDNDPINDLATSIVRDSVSDEVALKILTIYLGHAPSSIELRHAYCCFALCGWYWFCWSVFKDTLGEDGTFMLPSWRGMYKYSELALNAYKEEDGLKHE